MPDRQRNVANRVRLVRAVDGPIVLVDDIDSSSVVDVAIVYPANLPASAGGVANMQAQFAVGIAQSQDRSLLFIATGDNTTAELCPPMPSEVFKVTAPGSRGTGPSSSRR